MKLDQKLINEFVDVVNNANATKPKAKRYGTVYIDNGEYKVKIDGTDERLNFDSKSIYYESGERVNVDTSNNILNVTPILDKSIENLKKNNVKFGHDINSLNVKIDTGSGGGSGIQVASQGPKGDKGDTGEQGPKGDTGETGATGPQGVRGSNIYSTDQTVTLNETTNETIIALGFTVNILWSTFRNIFGDIDIVIGDYLLMNSSLYYIGRLSPTSIYMKPPIILKGDTGATGSTGPQGPRGSNIYATDQSVTLGEVTNETIIALGLPYSITLSKSQSLFGDADIAIGDYLLMNGALHYVGRKSSNYIYVKPPIVLKGDKGEPGEQGPQGVRGSNIYSTDQTVTLDVTTNETIVALGLIYNITLTLSQSLFGDADIAIGDYLLMNGALHYVGRKSSTRIYMKPPIMLKSSDVTDTDIDALF